MSRIALRWIGISLVVLIAYLFFSRMGWLPSPGKLFRPSPVLIDETPMLISEIRQISQLISLHAQDEVVVSSVKPAPAGSARGFIKLFTPVPVAALDKLVIIVKGDLQLGTDLRLLDSSRVFMAADSVSVRLPYATILDIQTNPSGSETFIEEGNWTQSEVTALKESARSLLAERATAKGLQERANQQSLRVMHDFLKSLGFRKITVLSER